MATARQRARRQKRRHDHQATTAGKGSARLATLPGGGKTFLFPHQQAAIEAFGVEVNSQQPRPPATLTPAQLAESVAIAQEADSNARFKGASGKHVDDMTKAELLEEAAVRGVKAYKSWTRPQILDAVRGAT